MSARPLYVGVDLGTTNSTAAVFDGDRVTFVRNAQGGALTPSVVRIDARGTVTVGARARRFLESDPENTRGEFKRLMGTAQRIEFPAAKTSRRPEELAAEVLRSLRADVREQLGVLPDRAVIAVPALFEIPQSAATSEAARLAGFERVELIQEPVASALAAGWTADDASGSWLVYDLGGGTFDASLLETRDGLLRVVGHDGDNFLGGRDIDWAIVDWVLAEVERAAGVRVRRDDPAHAAALRKVKLAVEEAKIELTRASEATIVVPGAFDAGGASIDVDVTLDRGRLDALCAPVIERSIEVCLRLLATHGLAPGRLARVVLVGGPTVMPCLRERVGAALGARFGEGLDPMTLVAHGAAIYAATAGLDARPAKREETPGRRVWLQYPAMSSDLAPHVVGRFVRSESGEGRLGSSRAGPAGSEGGAASGEPARLRVIREGDGWESATASVDPEGGFVLTVDLLPRRPNAFRIEAFSRSGERVPVVPATFTIVQGLTIADPPLSRTVGVALADDTVRVYFERGAPLPAKRTFRHHTVEGIAKGSAESALRIPIVQGEMEQAHLCRLVGTLEIAGADLAASLPAGSLVELTLELDRGGHLSARALVPAIGQVFERVAHLLVPEASPDALAEIAAAARTRLAALRGEAFRRGSAKTVDRLGAVERVLGEAEQDVAAARGGDADAAQKARRALLEIDAILEEAEMEGRWPELDDDVRKDLSSASYWVSQYGSPHEQKLLAEVAQAVDRARTQRQAPELARQLRFLRSLRSAAFYRHPEAWSWVFDDAASEVERATDLVRARELVERGRRAQERGDTGTLREVVQDLWKLLPADVQERRLGHRSGVR